MIPRRLKSPNVQAGAHWSKRHRETQTWELEILIAAPAACRAWSLIEATEPRRDRLGIWRIHEQRRHERRRIIVTRAVPRRRNFCRDAANRIYTTKPLHDALVRLGLLFDDSDRWIDAVIREEVSADGRDRTVIRIERLDAAPAGEHRE